MKEIQESIDHWNRMLKWAKKQRSKAHPESYFMEEVIGESWYGDHCPLCNKYRTMDCCGDCPLSIAGHECGYTNSPWWKVFDSDTWGKWCKNAKRMIKVLEELEK